MEVCRYRRIARRVSHLNRLVAVAEPRRVAGVRLNADNPGAGVDNQSRSGNRLRQARVIAGDNLRDAGDWVLVEEQLGGPRPVKELNVVADWKHPAAITLDRRTDRVDPVREERIVGANRNLGVILRIRQVRQGGAGVAASRPGARPNEGAAGDEGIGAFRRAWTGPDFNGQRIRLRDSAGNASVVEAAGALLRQRHKVLRPVGIDPGDVGNGRDRPYLRAAIADDRVNIAAGRCTGFKIVSH